MLIGGFIRKVGYGVENELIEVDFFKHIDLNNIEQELRRCWQIQAFASDDDNEIDADGDPNLRLVDGIDGVAEKMSDRQVLFDPFEKGLDRPPVAVDIGDGQEDKELVGFGISVRDTAQAIRVRSAFAGGVPVPIATPGEL